MRLLTDEIRQQFRKYPLYSQESKGINRHRDSKVF